MGHPRAVQGILDAPVAGLDDIGGDGADKGIEFLCLDRVDDALADLSRIETSGGQTLRQHRFVSRPDLRAAHVVGAITGAARDIRIDRTGADHRRTTERRAITARLSRVRTASGRRWALSWAPVGWRPKCRSIRRGL